MNAHTFERTVVLSPHPELLSEVVHSIAVRVSWRNRGLLSLAYILAGECDALRIPSPRPSTRVDGLWRHTCFEAFLAPLGAAAYEEFNFSPSGEWAHYHFSSYRQASPPDEEGPAPRILTRRTPQSLELDAHILLPSTFLSQPLRLALSAVIEEQSGEHSYWALKHPPGKPDFHHAEAFALEVRPLEKRP
jgi:hypothetical protein